MVWNDVYDFGIQCLENPGFEKHASRVTLNALLRYQRVHQQANRHVVLLWVGGCEKMMEWCDQLMTDEFQNSLKFETLTDVSVAHLPVWTCASPTRSHSPQYGFKCLGCLSTEQVSEVFFSSLWRFCSFHLLLVNSFSNFYAVHSLRRYKF